MQKRLQHQRLQGEQVVDRLGAEVRKRDVDISELRVRVLLCCCVIVLACMPGVALRSCTPAEHGAHLHGRRMHLTYDAAHIRRQRTHALHCCAG